MNAKGREDSLGYKVIIMSQKLFQIKLQPDLALIKEKYNIPGSIKLDLSLTEKGWIVATSPDLPGLITQAKSGKELFEMVNDAVLTYFNVPEQKIVLNKKHIIDGECRISAI